MEFTSLAAVASRPAVLVVGVRKVGVDLLRFAFGPETAEVADSPFHFGGMSKNRRWCDCDCCDIKSAKIKE